MNTVSTGRIFMFLLFVCPSPYVVAALGGSASPAMLLGLFMFGWWLITRINTSLSSAHTKQPLRIAVFAFLAAIMASCAAAYARVLSVNEAQAPLRGIAIAISFAGVILFFADGLRNRKDIEKMIWALVLGGAFVATIGILQYLTGNEIAPYLKLPGLSAVNDFTFISERNGLPRVAGTAYHPIEYAVILCITWPFALRNAVMKWSKKSSIVALIPVSLISMALPTALSRTSIVAFSIVVFCVWFVWSPKRRLHFVSVLVLGIPSLFIFVPDIPRVLIELFTKADQDVSITTRTDDYQAAGEYIRNSFFFGRGYKTFDPGTYFFLDNQFLLSLIEIGIVGTICLFILFATSITQARNVRHTSKDPFMRELGQCCVAALFAVIVCFSTFDTLSFPMVSFTTVLIMGLIGAMWRINKFENGDKTMEFKYLSSRIIESDEVLKSGDSTGAKV